MPAPAHHHSAAQRAPRKTPQLLQEGQPSMTESGEFGEGHPYPARPLGPASCWEKCADFKLCPGHPGSSQLGRQPCPSLPTQPNELIN